LADNVYALLQQAWSIAKTSDANMYGVEVALVTNVKDPEKEGRVKICFPRLPGKPESDWARVAQPSAGPGRGFYWLPEVNDEVLVAFERGQSNKPFVIGAVWNGKDKPMKDAYTDENTTRMIQTKSGHQIVFNDKSGEEKITIADGSGKRTLSFDVKEKKFLIEAKEGDVEIHAKKKLVLHCEDLEIKTKKTGKVQIGTKFDLKVAQKASIKSGPQMNLKAGKVNLNPPSLDLSSLAAKALAAAARAAAAAAGANARQQQQAAQAGAAAGGALGGGPGGGLVPTQDAIDPAAAGGAASAKGGTAPGGTDFNKPRDGAPGSAAAAGTQSGAGAAAAVAPDQLDIQVVNTAGKPQKKLEVELALPGGDKRAGLTDDAGHFKVEGLTEKGNAKVTIPDVQIAPAAPASAAGRIRFVEGGVDVPIGQSSVIEIPPRVRRCRLSGLNFETNKTFLLPQAMTGIRQLVKLFKSFEDIQGLVNGHTDKQPPKFGDPFEFNRKLSVERADAIAAYLTDDVEAWQKFYAGTGASGQWGVREDQMMLATVKDSDGTPFYDGEIDGKAGPKTEAAYRKFQRSRLLDERDTATPEMRRELVREYMKLEGTSLPKGTTLEIHGCGQTHPLPETEGDSNPDQPKNRRVEVYLFDGPIDPRPVDREPPGGCQEHAKWVGQMILDVDLDQPPGRLKVSVADEKGQPLTAAHVHASGPLPLDGDGAEQSFEDLIPGSYKVIANADGFEAADTTVTVPAGGTGTADLSLKPVATPKVKKFFGRKPGETDEKTEVQIAAGAEIEVGWEVENASKVQLSELGGAATTLPTQPMPAGDQGKSTTKLKPAKTTRFVVFAVQDAKLSPASGPVTVSVQATGAARVTVLDDQGKGIAKAHVHLSGPLTLDADAVGGVAAFDDIPPGDYKATATADGFLAADVTVQVLAGGRGAVTLALRAEGFDLDVRVVDKATPPQPVPEALVAVDPPAIGPQKTDADGRARFKLKRGKFRFTATHEGFLASEAEAEVPLPSSTRSALADAAVGDAAPAGKPLVVPLTRIRKVAIASADDHFAPLAESATLRYEIAGLENERVRLRVTPAGAKDPIFVRELDAAEKSTGAAKSLTWDGQGFEPPKASRFPVGPQGSPYRLQLIADGGPSDEREVKVLVKGIQLATSDEGGKWIMNFTDAKFPQFTIAATVSLLRTDGEGAPATGVPVSFSFSEPPDQNATPARSHHFVLSEGAAPIPLGKHNDPGAIFWEAIAGFESKSADGFRRTAVVETAGDGVAKLSFKPGGCGGDTYALQASVLHKSGEVLAEKRAAPVIVFRRLDLAAFEMSAVKHLSKTLSLDAMLAILDPKKTFVDIKLGKIVRLDPKLDAKYLALWKDGKDLPWEQAQKKLPEETPTQTQIDEANKGSKDAQDAIKKLAEAWAKRIREEQVLKGHFAWLKDAGLEGKHFILGGRYSHPKTGNERSDKDEKTREEGTTQEWTGMAWLRIDHPDPSGTPPTIAPDDRWSRGSEGVELLEMALIQSGIEGVEVKNLDRERIVVAHEVCHESQHQFHRRLFARDGHDDHSGLGLMDSTAFGGSLTPDEALILRGYDPFREAKPELQVRIVDASGSPLRRRPYRLKVVDKTLQGTTDDSGLAKVDVLPDGDRGALTILHDESDGTQTEVWTIELVFDKLPPPSDVRGAQIRLNNLGLLAGREDGVLDERTQRAIHRFQMSEGLPLGPLDQKTADRLKERHGS
jgi:peptidoglycan hydrolase-like protein with peptidoglycan-binding domain/phage baseplate assembly protein gpV